MAIESPEKPLIHLHPAAFYEVSTPEQTPWQGADVQPTIQTPNRSSLPMRVIHSAGAAAAAVIRHTGRPLMPWEREFHSVPRPEGGNGAVGYVRTRWKRPQ